MVREDGGRETSYDGAVVINQCCKSVRNTLKLVVVRVSPGGRIERRVVCLPRSLVQQICRVILGYTNTESTIS